MYIREVGYNLPAVYRRSLSSRTSDELINSQTQPNVFSVKTPQTRLHFNKHIVCEI